MPSNKYYSLAPNYEVEEYDKTDKMLKYALNEKKIADKYKSKILNKISNFFARNKEFNENRNYNIAITGNYGSGKSSFLYSFFARHSEYRFIKVSLGSLQYKCDENIENETNFKKEETDEIEENLKNTNEKKEKDKTAEKYEDKINKKDKQNIRLAEVETSILQQILYSSKPRKYKYSRYNRIDKKNTDGIIEKILIGLSIIYLAFYIINIKYSLIPEIKDNMILDIMFYTAFFYIAIKIILNIDTLNIMVKIGNSNFELSKIDKNSKSILNSNIEELIYYFKNTRTRIVVFEDIDRLDKKDVRIIFSRLRDINNIINSSIHGKSIQFIYSLSDSIFDTAEIRTKFFDFIIPIEPYAGRGNNVEVLTRMLSESSKNILTGATEAKAKLDKETVKEISNYLTNKRMINDFVNEYNIYYDGELADSDKEQLAFLILYKIMYSDRYEALFRQNNIFDKYFEDYSKCTSNDREKLKNKYQDSEDLNELEKKMLLNNIVKPNYLRLISFRHTFDLTNKEEKLITSIRNNEINPNYTTRNYKKLFDYTVNTDFANYSSFNIKLLKAAMRSKSRSGDIAKIIFDNINFSKLTVLINNENKIKLFKHYPIYLNDAWNMIDRLGQYTTNKMIDNLILYTIEYANIVNLINIELITKFFSTHILSILLLEENFDKIRFKIVRYNFKYSADIALPRNCKKMLNLIYENNMYELVKKHLTPIINNRGLLIDTKKIISSIVIFSDTEPLKKRVKENQDDFIKLLKEYGNQEDSDEMIKRFIESNNITLENFKEIMQFESKKIENLSIFSKDEYEYLISYRKYVVNWNNIEFIFSTYGTLDNEKDYLDTDVHYLTTRRVENTKLTEYLINHQIFSKKNFNKILPKIMKKNEYINKIDTLTTDYIEILTNHNKIKLENDYNCRFLSNNNELNTTVKAKIINNSLANIISLNIFQTDVIKKLLELNQDNYSLFNLVINYVKNNDIKEEILKYIKESTFKISLDDLKKLLSINYDLYESICIVTKYSYITNKDNINDILECSNTIVKLIEKNNKKSLVNNKENLKFINILEDYKVIESYHFSYVGKRISLKR